MTTEKSVSELAVELADLWFDERCVWKLTFDEAAGATWPWTVWLDWTQEMGPMPHEANWVTYTWEFYGETPEVAFSGAIEWCRALLPLKRCDACGGAGEYFRGGARFLSPREECSGTGLASGVAAETFYVIICRECGDGDDALPMPFTTPEARGSWAAAHTRATGHDRWFVLDQPRLSKPQVVYPSVTRYDAYPDHPLCGVPQEILDAAREVMAEGVEWKDVAPEMVEPLAHAVVAALRPWLKIGGDHGE